MENLEDMQVGYISQKYTLKEYKTPTKLLPNFYQTPTKLLLNSSDSFRLITVIKCLKGHKSLRTLCDGPETSGEFSWGFSISLL